MAKLVLGIGTSHSPQLSAPAALWAEKGEDDRNDPRNGDYDALARDRAGWIGPEITPEKMAGRHAAIQAALGTLAETFARAAPDVAVVIGDDQREVFTADHMPALNIHWAEAIENNPPGPDTKYRKMPWFSASLWGYYGEAPSTYPGEAALGAHLVRFLTGDGFDLSHTRKLADGQRIGHAFNFVYRRIMTRRLTPLVPVMLNTYYPPNQPPARRCYALGQALRRAVEAWDADKRVAVVASGGLSHTVIDAEMDRKILDAMARRDQAGLFAYPEAAYVHGTSEIKSWIALAGAMDGLDAPMELVDYVPAYRSPAGTGCGSAFAQYVVAET